jgi:amino acid transporter
VNATRDTGLVRAVDSRALAATFVNTLVGAGIFTVPAALAANIGEAAPFALVACAIAMGAIAVCFAEGGSRVPTSGGTYGYIDAAFGPRIAFITGTLLWVGNVLACAGIAAAAADLVASVVPGAAAAVTRALVIIGSIATVAWVNATGVSRGARLVNIVTVVKLSPLVVFVIVGAVAVMRLPVAASTPLGGEEIGRALILALFAFTGLEGAVTASGEVIEPARTIPRAIAMAMVLVTALYVAVQLVAQDLLGTALRGSSAPLADAIARVHPSLRGVMLAAAGVSMIGGLGSDLLATPRMLFAFARDGRMPRALGRVHPRTHAPVVAITVYAALAILLALTGTFAELAVLSTLAVAVLYIVACAAAWRLARAGVGFAGEPLNIRGLPAAATIGVVTMAGIIALGSGAEIAGVAAIVVISAVAYEAQASMRARRARVSLPMAVPRDR